MTMKIELGEGFGKKIQAALDKMAGNVFNASSVEIGWNKEARYGADKGGMPVASVAVTNEYGGTITIPEHTVSNYRQVDKSGEFARGGKFVKRAVSNFETTHTVPEHTVTIPPRPFFRGMVAAEKQFWPTDMAHALRESQYNMKHALGLMGEEITGKLQQSIIEFNDPANAPSTVARKGFNDPLVESGVMLRTANYTVK
jgi:hypothetical protein